MPASEVFSKWKAGQLHSGSKKGPVVGNQKQAIAIYLSEKRKEAQHGGKYPERADGGTADDSLFPPMPSPPSQEDIDAAMRSSMPSGPSSPPPVSNQPYPYPEPPPGPKIYTDPSRNVHRLRQMGGPVGMGQPPMPPGVGGMMPPQGLGGAMPSSMTPMMQGFRADGGAASDAAERLQGYRDLAAQMTRDKAARGSLQSLDADVSQGISDVVPHGVGGGYQFGGSPASMGLTPGYIERQEARNIGRTHLGPIMSTVGGRTDNHAISVPSGSYVLPAAHVSALGQGNSLNGMKVLQGMFGPAMNSPPPGVSPMRAMHSAALRPPPMPRAIRQQADGGKAELTPTEMMQMFFNATPVTTKSAGGSRGDAHVGKPVPIMAAGGEYVLSPQQVMRGPLKSPWNLSLDDGHAVLDHWVKKTHKKYAKTVASLPPPAKT